MAVSKSHVAKAGTQAAGRRVAASAKRWLAAAAAGVLAMSAGSVNSMAEDRTQVKLLAVENYPPYVYLDRGGLQGIFVRIVREAAATLDDYDVDLDAVPARRGMLRLRRGLAAGILPIAGTDQDPLIARRSAPFFERQVVSICNDRAFDRINGRQWPADFAGMRLGRVLGTVHGGENLLDMVAMQIADLYEASTLSGGMGMLFLGRIDCFLTDNLAFLVEMNHMRHAGRYDRTKAEPFTLASLIRRESIGIGYSDGRQDQAAPLDFVVQFDAALSALVLNGRVDDIVAEALR